MKDELFKVADELAELMPKNQQDVIKVFKETIDNKKLNSARIISDGLVDFYLEYDKDGQHIEKAENLYNKTMEYYELNS